MLGNIRRPWLRFPKKIHPAFFTILANADLDKYNQPA